MTTKRRGVLSARQAAELVELGLSFQESGKQVRKIERAVLLAAARRIVKCASRMDPGGSGPAWRRCANIVRVWAKELRDGD